MTRGAPQHNGAHPSAEHYRNRTESKSWSRLGLPWASAVFAVAWGEGVESVAFVAAFLNCGLAA